MVVRIQIAFKTIPIPEDWEFESKEDHLTAIELSETDSFTQQVEQHRYELLGNKNVW